MDDRLRIRQPMVREGYLRHGPRRADGSELPVAMTLRRIVYAHEGQIQVNSEAANGASFEIILPRQAPLPAPASVEPDSGGSPACRVLVVDDEPEVAACD